MNARLILTLALLALPVPVGADDGGELNPEEMTLGRMLDNARSGKPDMMTCASGYLMTKKGDHTAARDVFSTCADAGYVGAMTWMSQLDDNGLGAAENPDAATEWSRRAADAGDEIGKFNYGVSLMRGRGVARNEAAGRALVDEAADEGLEIARRLQGAEYDLDEVTPDADNWKYAPLF